MELNDQLIRDLRTLVTPKSTWDEFTAAMRRTEARNRLAEALGDVEPMTEAQALLRAIENTSGPLEHERSRAIVENLHSNGWRLVRADKIDDGDADDRKASDAPSDLPGAALTSPSSPSDVPDELVNVAMDAYYAATSDPDFSFRRGMAAAIAAVRAWDAEHAPDVPDETGAERYLAERLQDPEYRRSYEEARERIDVPDELVERIVDAWDCAGPDLGNREFFAGVVSMVRKWDVEHCNTYAQGYDVGYRLGLDDGLNDPGAHSNTPEPRTPTEDDYEALWYEMRSEEFDGVWTELEPDERADFRADVDVTLTWADRSGYVPRLRGLPSVHDVVVEMYGEPASTLSVGTRRIVTERIERTLAAIEALLERGGES